LSRLLKRKLNVSFMVLPRYKLVSKRHPTIKNITQNTCIPVMGSIENTTDYGLTQEQKDYFMSHGFVKIEKCFTREAASNFTSALWTRLGFSPTDKTTWTVERTHMPRQNEVAISEFAPRAWSAIRELVNGPDGDNRISDEFKMWADGFIVNLGKEEYSQDDELDFRSLENWHTDGDFFVHYLDSPEQALLVIPLFSDIETKGGGTAVCTDGIGLIARHLVRTP
jgi:hypothetical protein